MPASLALGRKRIALKKAFTLVELLTITVIVTVLAAIVVPRLQNFRDGNEFLKGIQRIESAANKAKNEAISTGKTYELTFDSATQSLKVRPSEDDSSSVLDTNDASNTSTSQEDGAQQSDAGIGSGWSVYEVRNAKGDTDSELRIKFYADGTAESKSVEFHNGDAPVTLTVTQNGVIDVKRGALSNTDDKQEWEAGNIEQRTTSQ